MRALLPLTAMLALIGLVACGDQGSDEQPRAAVRLSLAAPEDQAVVRSASVAVTGTVRPVTATVLVRGRRAATSGGRFTATVPLDAGTNVLDVVATAGGDRPALAALRVRRQLTVTVPDLGGDAVDVAQQALRDAGLVADVQKTGSLLDDLFGGDQKVCETDPVAGTHVDTGSTVTLLVSRGCSR
jgi:hypothetical protein